ncbi:hypothetical protein [Taklimakanibacter albus]|uniref:Uncharacterized protein n=1 Tax=Taklimakanibacter albus TaxID=2800327 RepID=A0ACC5R016_9HYPH|nr:hypothetical protein [Aestuariivirga sp. YIM B02566]MBK1865937.1 hypothetical protein [Aestuariivirga sp. YIM B02566]
MDRHKKHLLWSAAAFTFGLVSMPPASQSLAVEEGRAIDRLPEIRAVLRDALEQGRVLSVPSGSTKLAQDWPNWTNWGNG